MAPQQVRKLAFFPAAQQEPELLLTGQFIHVTSLTFTWEVETSNNNLIAEYMLNNISIHVLVSSSEKVMESVLIHAFSCCPAISISYSAIARTKSEALKIDA